MAESNNKDMTGDQSATSSSSGGEGGLFGNASASLGDVGIGTSAAESGDVNDKSTRNFSFAGPVVNQGIPKNWLYIGAAVAAFWFFKGRK
tara:strand:+ start:3032 stop:3301 length:270 start_codon:yes stop_codon:yes gene_type:complete